MMRLFGLSLILLAFTAIGSEYLSHELNGQVLHIQTDEGALSITALAGDSFEVFYQPKDIKQLPSFAIDGVAKQTELTISDEASRLTLSAPGIRAQIEKSPLRIRYFRDGEMLLSRAARLVYIDD